MTTPRKTVVHCYICGVELPPRGAVEPVDKDGNRVCRECWMKTVDGPDQEYGEAV